MTIARDRAPRRSENSTQPAAWLDADALRAEVLQADRGNSREPTDARLFPARMARRRPTEVQIWTAEEHDIFNRVTPLIAVVVGAFLGYGAVWVQRSLDRRRRRRGLATAMLLELRRVERNLRDIATSDRAVHATVSWTLTAHRLALAELDLFAPMTTGAVFDFISCIADVERGFDMITAGRLERNATNNWMLQTRAAFAANRVDAVKTGLLSEGGSRIRERDVAREFSTYPAPPHLEPPSFPQPLVDRAT